MSATTRFRHIDPHTDAMYIGVAEITINSFNEQYEYDAAPAVEANILQIWECGIAIEEVNTKRLPIQLICAIEQTAIEQFNNPPSVHVEIPTDWDLLEILEVETSYTVKCNAALPSVKSDEEAQIYGLSKVRRIQPVSDGTGQKYIVKALGDISTMRIELHKVKLF